MLLLRNPIQAYAWGAVDGIARLVGSVPTGGPEAELWVGTHPLAPSVVASDPAGRTLAEVIAADPVRWLGAELAGHGHTALPFMLKVLAIGSPLSLQAHPSAEQAAVGFAREEAAGIARDAPTRTYRDPNPKPEALVALLPTTVVCGFRSVDEALALVVELAIADLAPLVEQLTSGHADAMRSALSWVLRQGASEQSDLAGQIASVVARVPAGVAVAPDADEALAWVRRLGIAHPGDLGCLAPLLLHVVHLAPGDAVHLPAGNLHAYLDGAGVEVMAASDNVLRGGLTPKHIDVDELLSVLEFAPGIPTAPTMTAGPGVQRYEAGEEAFGLVCITAGDSPVVRSVAAPGLLLAEGGAVRLSRSGVDLVVDHGAAAFVAPGADPVQVSGPGRLWWASTGPGLRG